MKILLSLLTFLLLTFFSISQKIISSYPKKVDSKVISTITVKCVDVDFLNKAYSFSFSNKYGSDFIVIQKKEFLCKDVVKLTIKSSDYFSSNFYDLTISDNSSNTYTLEKALLVYNDDQAELVSIDKKSVKKGSKLTVKFSGLKTHFKSSQASQTVVSLNNYQASPTIQIKANSIYVNSETDLDATFEIPTDIISGVYFPRIENDIDYSISINDYRKSLYIEGDKKVMITSVQPLNSASNTLQFRVTFNQDFDLKSASNTVVGSYFNDEFYAASSTITSSNQLVCEIEIPYYVYNGSYPLYFFYNNEYVYFENAIIINSNPIPTIINFPIKVYAGKNNHISLQGLNVNFAQASSSLAINFGQGSSTVVVEIDKSMNNNSIDFDLYVPKNIASGFYSSSLFKKYYSYYDVLIGSFKNSIEVINENAPIFSIKDSSAFLTNNTSNIKVQKSGDIDIINDIKEIYVYFEPDVKTPVYVSNISNETITLSCFISPLVNSGNYKIYFESNKDGVFVTSNEFKVKGKNPFIYQIQPSIVSSGKSYDFTLKMDNVILNEENLKGLYFEFQDECNALNTILSYNSDSVVVRVNVDKNVLDGDYKVLLMNSKYQIISQEILSVRSVTDVVSVPKLSMNAALNIFPNPSISGNFSITIDEKPYLGDYTITDLQGKMIYQHTLENSENHLSINPGIYIVSLQIDNRVYNEKISVE